MGSSWAVPTYGEEWTVPGYTDERDIGRGASGRVVEAVNDESGNRVAIKYLGRLLTGDVSFMWRLRADVQQLRELGIPQVVEVYDYVEHPGQGAAIVMELVNGVSLHEIIERGGPAGAEAALAALKSSLLGLAAAHTLGVVHRDYKPENVLVDTEGNSKLVDFGVAVRWGRQVPTAGTPLYLAPEQWHGAPASQVTDIYAAAAVFHECLTGKPPFSGKLPELREQHVSAAVPVDGIDPLLQGIVARGMAKNPEARPQSAIGFVSEIEALASGAFGPDWEERGRSQLAGSSAALLPVLRRESRPGVSERSYASTWQGGDRKGRILTSAAIAAGIVLVLGGGGTAIALRGNNTQASLSDSSATDKPSFSAVASVTPPVAATTCATPTSFAFTATLSATAAGTMKYQWVYSSGKPGPVQTVSFAGAGKKVVTGETLKLEKAGPGWGELKMVSPAAQTLDKASYLLMCGAGNSQVTASAAVEVPSGNVTCGTAAPALTAIGSVSDAKKGKVTYHWTQSDGVNSAPQTLDFTAPGTLAVAPLTITPPGDPGSGSAVLVVTSPVAATSNSASYTLSCTPLATTSPSPTPSKSSPTPTPTHTTATPTPTPSKTSPTPTPTPTPTPSKTPTPTPTPSTPTPTPTPSNTSPSPAPSGTSSTATASSPAPTTSAGTASASPNVSYPFLPPIPMPPFL